MSLMSSRLLLAATLIASTAACSHLPGGGGGAGGVDPSACGGFSGAAAGASLKAFIQSTKDLNDATTEAANTIKTACVTMGNELGMPAADLGGTDTGAICNKVISTYKNNLQVSLKGSAALKVDYKPGACTVDASASASASAECSGGASGTAGTGGASGGASGQCAAAASAEASVHASCTPPELKLSFDASMAVDAAKATMTIKAMQDGLPQNPVGRGEDQADPGGREDVGGERGRPQVAGREPREGVRQPGAVRQRSARGRRERVAQHPGKRLGVGERVRVGERQRRRRLIFPALSAKRTSGSRTRMGISPTSAQAKPA